jgi:hypothetical protein
MDWMFDEENLASDFIIDLETEELGKERSSNPTENFTFIFLLGPLHLWVERTFVLRPGDLLSIFLPLPEILDYVVVMLTEEGLPYT